MMIDFLTAFPYTKFTTQNMVREAIKHTIYCNGFTCNELHCNGITM